MSFVKGQDREQIVMSSLEDMIPLDSQVRLMDLLVDGVISQDPESYHWKGLSDSGRPAYSPSVLLKLYLYGYSNKIVSSRKLEIECKRNIELKWLLKNLSPDFKTIADYRKDNSVAISKMTVSFKVLLKNSDLITGNLVALDGTKIKANASPARNLNEEDIKKRICSYEEEISNYLSLLQQNDIKEDLTETDIDDFTTIESITEKISDLRAKKEYLQNSLKRRKDNNDINVSSTDSESRLVKNRKEMFYGYNLQVLVDSLYKLIISARMQQSPNDLNQMLPLLDNLKKELDIEPEEIVADRGYSNTRAIQDIEKERSTNVYVPIDEPKGEFSKQNFAYDVDNNQYICPKGHVLKQTKGLHKKRNRLYLIYQCNSTECDQCPSKLDCTKSTRGRTITRFLDEEWVKKYKQRIRDDRGNSLLQKRMAMIEHVFGILKCWMGKIPLLMRGRKKVQTEINLYVTAYNLKRVITLFGFDQVKAMILSLNHS